MGDRAGRVAIVTGAAAGLGRAEAVGLAADGVTVVVNDIAPALEASDVVEAITEAGGSAVAVAGDVAERSTTDALLRATVDDLGRLDIVVNNAGIVRDRMLFNMSDEEWDAVIRVHLRGHFLLTQSATSHWRTLSKATGEPSGGRLINTSSEAGLLGPEGQANYGAAKAGITALTLSAARILGRYGATANAICPRARTAMTEAVFGPAPEQGVDPLSPDHVVALVRQLASPESEAITGQVFVVYGPRVALLSAPSVERVFDASDDHWGEGELGKQLTEHFTDRDPGGFSASAAVAAIAEPRA